MSRPALPYQVMQTLSECVIVLDRKGEIVYANPAFEDLFNPSGEPLERLGPPELHDLVRSFRKSKKAHEARKIRLPPTDKGFEITLSSLDKYIKEKGFSLVVMKREALEGLLEPLETAPLIERAIHQRKAVTERLDPAFEEIKGEDPAFRASLARAQKAARSDLPILILGESGTGKEMLARIIHRVSSRRRHAFVDINCCAIPDTLIESELFGYEKGAFTGALREGKRGLFEEANHGTIFLDEIADASPSVQAKLLRVLQDGHFKKVGGTKNVRVDVRIISATNRNLESLFRERLFRDDLYYRLNTFSITLPALNARGNDIRLLAEYFLRQQVPVHGHPFSFSIEAIRVMESYGWPGNTRELKAVVDFAVAMSPGPGVGVESLPPFLLSDRPSDAKDGGFDDLDLSSAGEERLLPAVLQKVEKDLMKKAIEASGSMSEAIRLLGISRRSFYVKLKKYGLK